MRTLFFILFFLSSLSLRAAYPGQFTGRVELLYFKPTIDQSFYAISSSDNTFQVPDRDPEFFPNGKRYNNNPSFRPAFRLEGAYTLCNCNELDLRFTYFNESHTDSVSGPFLFDTIGYPGNGAQRPEDTSYNGVAKYKEHFRYYAVDGTFNRLTINCCPENLSLLFGVHFAYIKVEERASSDGTSINTEEEEEDVTNRFSRHSHFWGLGPQFGIDYRFYLPRLCCFSIGAFSLRANARAALLATNTWADLHYHSTQTGSVGANLDNQTSWRLNPCADVKIGFVMEYPMRCANVTFEVGYELIWYSDAVNAITGYDVAFAGDSIDLFSNFNLQGPYLALGAAF